MPAVATPNPKGLLAGAEPAPEADPKSKAPDGCRLAGADPKPKAPDACWLAGADPNPKAPDACRLAGADAVPAGGSPNPNGLLAGIEPDPCGVTPKPPDACRLAGAAPNPKAPDACLLVEADPNADGTAPKPNAADPLAAEAA